MKPHVVKYAAQYGFRPSLIAAIICRETAALDMYCFPPPKGKLGDGGHGAGPMQIDDRSFPAWHKDWSAGKLSLESGIEKGCEVLSLKLKEVTKAFPNAPHVDLLRYAVAAYNSGLGGVRKSLSQGTDPDARTTSKNYSADVLEMATFLSGHFDS